MGWFTLGKQAIIKGSGKIKDKKTRDVIAGALKEHRASKSYKMHKKTMQKIPHDLTYMKGYLKGK